MAYMTANGTCMIQPKKDEASAMIVCSGQTIKKMKLSTSYSYTTPASCSAYWSNSPNPTTSNAHSLAWGGVDVDGRNMHSGRDIEENEVLLFHPMENELKLKAEHKTAVTQPSVGKEEEDVHDSVKMMLLGATIAIAILTTIGGSTITILIIQTRRKSRDLKTARGRATYRRKTEEEVTLNIEDACEVADNEENKWKMVGLRESIIDEINRRKLRVVESTTD